MNRIVAFWPYVLIVIFLVGLPYFLMASCIVRIASRSSGSRL
jgi:hypothetical protein